MPNSLPDLHRILEQEEPSSLRLARDFYRSLLDSLYDGVYFVDADGRITYWNSGAEQLTGYRRDEVVNKPCCDRALQHADDRGGVPCLAGSPIAATLADGERRETEVYLRHKLGHRIPINSRIAPIKNSRHQVIGAVEIFNDISAKKRAEKIACELEAIAFIDPVTGIHNRRYMQLRMEQALANVDQPGKNAFLFLIDLDKFKQVNDTFGHVRGDAVLRAICRNLACCLRPGDTIGRWGGDEIAVLVIGLRNEASAALAERCRRLIADASSSDDLDKMTASIGAVELRPGDTVDAAVGRADALLYQCKARGGDWVMVG